MVAIIEGVVLELFEKDEKLQLAQIQAGQPAGKILCVRLYQKGEKKLTEVKDVPADLAEGELVQLECKLFPWASDRGQADISCTFISRVA